MNERVKNLAREYHHLMNEATEIRIQAGQIDPVRAQDPVETASLLYKAHSLERRASTVAICLAAAVEAQLVADGEL